MNKDNWKYYAQGEIPLYDILFLINGEEFNLQDDIDTIHLYFLKRKSDPFVNRSYLQKMGSDIHVEHGLKLKSNVLHFLRYPEWTLPDEIKWNEDPFTNRNWQWLLHQLAFIPYMIGSHIRTKDSFFLEKMCFLITSWKEHNVASSFPSELSWHDHATSSRLRNLLFCFEYLSPDYRKKEFIKDILLLIYIHCHVLKYEAFYSKKTNHGLDQSYTLFWASKVFYEFSDAPLWEETGQTRTEYEITSAFSEDGVHIENSPAYHGGLLSMINSVNHILKNYSQTSVSARVDDINSKAIKFLTYITRPDGCFPNIGDSTKSKVTFNSFIKGLKGFDELHFALSQGRKGVKPEKPDMIFPEGGYAVFRDKWHDHHTALQTLYFVFKCSFLSRYHRHDDDLSFVLYAYGEDWIVDSGLYKYQEKDPLRIYVRSSDAHNVPLVNELTPTRNPKHVKKGWGISKYSSEEDKASVMASTYMYPGYLLTRTVEYFRPDRFIISDSMKPLSNSSVRRSYDLAFQIPSDKEIETLPSGVLVKGRQGHQLQIQCCKGYEWDIEVFSGATHPQVRGWISEQLNEVHKAHSILFKNKGSYRATQIELSFSRVVD